MIHNLSDHTLTEDEFSVLTKGLSFVPTPSRTFQREMNISWNKLKTHMLTQYFFCNNIHDKPLHPFKRKFNRIPPPCDNPTLVDFLSLTEQELISINTPCRKTYSNLTVQEKTALNNLKNNQSIIIKPCDKSRGIYIINTRDYLTKIYTPTRPHYIQTTHPQPNKCNSQRCMHSHRLSTFPTHN